VAYRFLRTRLCRTLIVFNVRVAEIMKYTVENLIYFCSKFSRLTEIFIPLLSEILRRIPQNYGRRMQKVNFY
jgi:hypothetical protein